MLIEKDGFNFLSTFIYLGNLVCMCHGACVEIRKQYLFSPSTLWVSGLKTGYQAQQQVPSPTKFSH